MKPTAAQLDSSRNGTLPDILAPGLRVMFVGVNPSLYSAAIGHHFGRPGNRFWPALHRSGWTPRQLDPSEDRSMPQWGLGLTNLVDRATARADELDAGELSEGAARLHAKVEALRPAFVAVVGVTAFRTAFGCPRALLGPQVGRLGAARVWVLPNPSGLNAHYSLPRLVEVYAEFRSAVDAAGLQSC